MTLDPTTNFKDSNGVDLGKKLVTKDYLLDVYPEILNSLGNSGLTVSPALWVWGENVNGGLGVNSVGSKITPVTTFAGGTNWKQVSGGSRTHYGIKTDGTLWVWGENAYGELGINNIITRSTPVTTFAGGTNWKQVSSGFHFVSAIKTDGTLWVWGKNDVYGQLGINNLIIRSTPVTTFAGGTDWKFANAGSYHMTALKTDGTLWTWGRNSNGGLGINNNTGKSTPVTTFAGGTNWKSVAGADIHTLAIKTDGTLWVWGDNTYSQIGNIGTLNVITPVTTFAGGTNWKTLPNNGGIYESAAIKTDGTLWVWGRNNAGQLGINNTQFRSTPVTTFAGGANWKSIACGYNVMRVIKTDGTLWTWGGNGTGQLATNDTNARSTPVTTFLGGNDWKQVSGEEVTGIAISSQSYI